jgi:polyisoprenoid-binding protein YceI
MNLSTFSIVALGAASVACKTTETVANEYNSVSDVPSPSDDIDDIPLEELEEADDEREQNNDEQDSGDDSGDGSEGTAPEPEPTIAYDFDEENSLIYVQVFKDEDAWLSGMAHNHVIRADGYSGEVEYNLDDLSACRIAFSLDVSDLQVDESGMREFVGYDEPLADDDRTEIRSNMLEPGQLNGDAYDTIDFESSECTGDGGAVAELQVSGGLRVRGVDANVTPTVNVTVYDGKLYAQATFEVNHASFGMSPYSFLAGAVRNADPLRFTIDIVANATN